MAYREIVVHLHPRERETGVSVVVRDTGGASRVDRECGRISLPITRAQLSGWPVTDVLRYLGEALADAYDTRPPQAVPAPPEGDMGESLMRLVNVALPGL